MGGLTVPQVTLMPQHAIVLSQAPLLSNASGGTLTIVTTPSVRHWPVWARIVFAVVFLVSIVILVIVACRCYLWRAEKIYIERTFGDMDECTKQDERKGGTLVRIPKTKGPVLVLEAASIAESVKTTIKHHQDRGDHKVVTCNV